MKFSDSLKKNYEFRRLYSKGKSTANPLMAVYYRKMRSRYNRVGITVSNKLGKAVVRNRIRRRLREIYRLNEEKLTRGMDIVIVARARSRYVGYHELEKAFLTACERLGILADSKNGDIK